MKAEGDRWALQRRTEDGWLKGKGKKRISMINRGMHMYTEEVLVSTTSSEGLKKLL